jgi:hypothetical protein
LNGNKSSTNDTPHSSSQVIARGLLLVYFAPSMELVNTVAAIYHRSKSDAMHALCSQALQDSGA